ncbi:hypothetical protein SKAU_G00006510 [Synaphobranchus kaupii]|uniref:Uncharacterized protein n=1 Tax=Synaphobranchus kaupii TaxID=118154 RepID=A0A9Q1JBR5_SYNKA|nr:hypothetical protein SKAU_G00006510 [Synaphobranchus kaupii]
MGSAQIDGERFEFGSGGTELLRRRGGDGGVNRGHWGLPLGQTAVPPDRSAWKLGYQRPVLKLQPARCRRNVSGYAPSSMQKTGPPQTALTVLQ